MPTFGNTGSESWYFTMGTNPWFVYYEVPETGGYGTSMTIKCEETTGEPWITMAVYWNLSTLEGYTYSAQLTDGFDDYFTIDFDDVPYLSGGEYYGLAFWANGAYDHKTSDGSATHYADLGKTWTGTWFSPFSPDQSNVLSPLIVYCTYTEEEESDIGKIGIWYDAEGTQTWTTSFVQFPFNTEYRNDGIYNVSGSGKGFQLTQDGNYLCLTYIHGEGGNNRENLQTRTLLDGTEVQGSRGTGYQRDTTNNQIYTRGSCMLLGATSGQIVTVQARRDSDSITNTAVANFSELMLVRLPDDSDVAFSHYGSTYDLNNFDGTSWNNGLWEDKIVETDNTKISGGTGSSAGAQHFAILCHCGEDGGDGYIPVLYGSNPVSNGILNIACDEDDIGDSERNHTTEDMMYFAFDDKAGNIKNSVGTIIGEYSSQADVDDSWTTVNLVNTYTYPIIVGTHNLASSSDPPETVRISGATSTSFKVRLDAASATAESAGDVYFMVMESGQHTLPGGDDCEAGVVPDSSHLAPTFGGGMHQLSLAGSYTNIAVFTQIYGWPENKFLQGWTSNNTQTGAPTPAACYVGRHNGADTDDVRANTDIHWIVIERGTGTTDGINWDAGITADNIAGVDDAPPYTHNLSGFSTTSDLANGNIIRLNPSGTRFLVLYSLAHNLGASDVRTQRISRAAISSATKYEGIPQSYGYCYIRDDENQYGETNAWFIHKTTEDDELLLIQAQRGHADSDSGPAGSGFASSQSAVFVMELPSTAETFISHDSTGSESVGGTASVYVSWMRDVDQNDSAAFTQASVSSMNVEKECDVLLLANGLIDRQTTSGDSRTTAACRWHISGVNQTRGQHGFYLRGDQSSTDTFNATFNPAGIFKISSNYKVCLQTFDDGGDGHGDDDTQANQCGFCALNLDSLYTSPVEPSVFYTSFSTMVGSPTLWVWNSGQFDTDEAPGIVSVDAPVNITWDWIKVSSSSMYWYPSGSPTNWSWCSGDA